MKRVLLILGGVIISAVFISWWFSPKQVLQRRVASMLDSATVPPGMSDAGRKARGAHVMNYLADQVTVMPPDGFDSRVPNQVGRDNASALYSGAAIYSKEITFTDLTFDEVSPDVDQATVRFKVDAIVDLPTRRPVDGILHVDSHWEKQNGSWLLNRLSWTESPR